MRLVRYLAPEDPEPQVGIVDGDHVTGLGVTDMVALIADGGARPTPSGAAAAGPPLLLADVRLLAPLPNPGKMLFLGRTFPGYRDGVPDDDPPFVYVRVASSIIGPGEPIRLPRPGARLLYEGELAAVIGRSAYRVPAAEALDHVFGFTQVNDVTWPEWPPSRGESDLPQISFMKNADSFCPMGPWLVTADEFDATRAEFTVTVNEEVRTRGATADLVWGLAEIVELLSRDMTLHPGDLIALGTPDAQPIAPGDVVTVEFAGLGQLANPVVDAR